MHRIAQRVLAVALVVVALSGCATRINRVMDSWVGHHESELLAAWGAPQVVLSNGYGGKVLVYTARRAYTTPATATTTVTGTAQTRGSLTTIDATGATVYTPGQTYGYQAQRLFWINPDGRIYRWSWKGL